jgi:bifunctional DNA-binding transcriptional regulator/antitoxin component of YhaV-PrlF toxin-antitoxin module
MERYSSRTLDEQGRIVVHSELRKSLKLETGDKFSFTLVGTIIILQKLEGEPEPNCAVSKINELGAITIPSDMRKQLGWNTKDKIAVYFTDNLLILKSAGVS